MNNENFNKILFLILFGLDCVLLLGFFVYFLLVATKVTFFASWFMILVIIVAGINLLFVGYILLYQFLHRSCRK